MSRPWGVIEDIDRARHIPIGRVWGVRVAITPVAWLGPIIFFGLGFLSTFLTRPELDAPARIATSLISALAVELSITAHGFGHILSGRMIDSAMDELLLTTTRDITLYSGDQSRYPARVHIIRSLGGPLLNLVLAGVFHALLPATPAGWGRELAGYLASVNTVLGVGSFLPIPTVDGEVIWREVFRRFAGRAST